METDSGCLDGKTGKLSFQAGRAVHGVTDVRAGLWQVWDQLDWNREVSAQAWLCDCPPAPPDTKAVHQFRKWKVSGQPWLPAGQDLVS